MRGERERDQLTWTMKDASLERDFSQFYKILEFNIPIPQSNLERFSNLSFLCSLISNLMTFDYFLVLIIINQ